MLAAIGRVPHRGPHPWPLPLLLPIRDGHSIVLQKSGKNTLDLRLAGVIFHPVCASLPISKGKGGAVWQESKGGGGWFALPLFGEGNLQAIAAHPLL